MKKKSTLFKKCCMVLSISICSITGYSQSPQAKIDLNMNGRPATEVDEPGWTPWIITNGGPDSMKVNNIEFVLRKGRRGATLSATYYKAGVQSPNFARLTCDGVFIKDGDAALGSEIQLTVRGLPAGKHLITTYHNATDNLTPVTVCPIDVHLNGVETISNLVPSIRVFKETQCKTASLEVTAVDGQDVVIRMIADTTGTQANKTVFLNAITLNVVNPDLLSRTPTPAHKDEHVDAPSNAFTLKWETAPAATNHEIYFGKDSAAVANADKTSPLYKGSQVRNDSLFAVANLYSMDTYYWRVDEVDANGSHKGAVWMFRTRQLAFPGAEGYGRFARGGRGGKVVEVTNLNDNGVGSLRWAVTNNIGPRTIVFKVSGIIRLNSRLVLADPNVTIAGQTAPGKGICLRAAPFGVGGNDAILRFVRLRLGAGTTYDGMGMNGDNSIMDHCSISWTIDEGFSSRGAKNITLQRTMIAEALDRAFHSTQTDRQCSTAPDRDACSATIAHGYAATIGGSKGSFHHNLLAHNQGRNWSMGGGLDGAAYYAGQLDMSNNVVYNWVGRTTDGGAKEVNFVNNYYKPGPASKIFVALTADHEGAGLGTQRYYFNGNVMPGRFDETSQDLGKRYTGTPTWETWVSAPFFPSEITMHTARDAYKHVLSDVGANQPFFDEHDQRMVRETRDSTFTYRGIRGGLPGIIDDQADAGGYEPYWEITRADNWDTDHDGMPDWWETAHGFNPNSTLGDFSESNGDPDHDGFTHLEAYLEWMANPHYMMGPGETIDIDLKSYTRGFEKSPVFNLTNIVNGTVTIVNDTIARFVPVATGKASFNFTVTDAAGSSMTRSIGLFVSNEFLLPVTMISFEARRVTKQEVALTWKTSQENNNSHFNIYRSTKNNGQGAVLVATVKSKATNGNSAQSLNYSFNDANSFDGLSYYHIVQVDKDGKSKSSETRIVKGIGSDRQFKVWPVPSKGDFNVSVANFNSTATINVFDAQGRLMLAKKIADNTVSGFTIPAKGVYWVKVTDAGNTGKVLFTEKLVVY
ncbi:MAG TPA: T9SS type A sorting domain-containing protein [Phnomibacter sp.]|nr:T9SS type A sorting domain-containing protein [Phnomibacter sp.]